jgi:hypothetical protein
MAGVTIYCKKCKNDVRVPVIETVVKETIATQLMLGAAHAMKALRDATGCDLSEAKLTTLHLVTTRGTWHRRSGRLVERVGVCPECVRVNIDWLPDES